MLPQSADLVEGDFAFEVELVFPTWTERSTMDQIAYVGIGEPNSNQSPDPCVCMSIRPPEINGGHVDVTRSAEGTTYRGGEMKVTNLRGRGPHIVRIEKKGNTVTFALDVDADGKDAADAKVNIADIAEYAPFLHKKNSHIILGGGARFTNVRFAVEN